ncbi:MAG: L-carnitine dehydratase/bile acid-inducible protein [Ilumatobacteraceae bacterium]|nr:L-carnitine dehydratase/bile acid-inducible protein [Ilumatobacteraceae bacterium]
MGPLDGVRVVELTDELSAWAGKLMADLGADVIVVEPPGGSRQRSYGPFLDDEPGPERSLYWWHYNTSKHSVVLDGSDATDRARLATLVGGADVLLAAHALDRASFAADNERLITVSVLAPENSVDLTLLAEGGPAWSCGYDDHTLPPVRGGGNQGFHTASHWAVISTLVALLEREESGLGQHIDVSALAASNVTTELATYGWLSCGVEVQRQTGRHANSVVSMPTQLRCADGRYVNAGIIARKPAEFDIVLAWLDSHGLRDEFPLTAFLEMGSAGMEITGATLRDDPVVLEVVMSVREAQEFVANRVPAYEFFTSAQRFGLAAGIVYAPEELFDDPHLQARGWPTAVEHPELGTTHTYPGAPYRFSATPWAITRRAPLLGEDQPLLAP